LHKELCEKLKKFNFQIHHHHHLVVVVVAVVVVVKLQLVYHKNWTTDGDKTWQSWQSHWVQRLDVQRPIATIADCPYGHPLVRYPKTWGK